MGRGKSIAKLAVGLLLTVLILWNIYFGLYQEYSPKKMHKLVLTMFIGGKCGESTISSDLDATGSSDCLEPLGTWGPIDALLLGIGLMLTWKALRALFSNKRPMGPIGRGRGLIRLGFLFIVIGVADMFGMLTSNDEPIDASEVFGFGLPEPGVAFLFLTLGLATLLSGILLKRKGGDMILSKDGSHAGARKFLGPAERHLGNDFSVGELRRALMLDAFEDPFQVNSGSDMDGYSVGRVCHYCSGAGCEQCGNTGEM
ncbi:MAG: hypothetical protein VX320_01620 [Candidatus Thermoplasmatota archaeon]|nr:hypothetical protein [Candidatus Thermoplasmatota archaeon]